MTVKRSCGSCNQCVSSNFDAFSWCKLRKIKIHSEISSFVSCGHWIKKESNFPKISQKFGHQQLDFGKVLVE
jgi:hypothetical protein